MRNDLYFQNFDARAPRNGCTESIVRFTINFRSFFQSCAYFVKPCSRSLGRIWGRAFEFRSPVPRTFDNDNWYWNLEMIKFRRYPKPYFPNPAEAEGQKIKKSASHHVRTTIHVTKRPATRHDDPWSAPVILVDSNLHSEKFIISPAGAVAS